MSYELKNIKVLGYTTDFNQCECCGKSDLKGTVSILDLNTDVVLHFGTACSVNANKYDDLNALKLAKKEINLIKRDRDDSIKFAAVMSVKLKLENKMDIIINDYMKFREVKENKIKRFNWEAYL
jgi:recombinational DNA repair protein (RecF pathway)